MYSNVDIFSSAPPRPWRRRLSVRRASRWRRFPRQEGHQLCGRPAPETPAIGICLSLSAKFARRLRRTMKGVRAQVRMPVIDDVVAAPAHEAKRASPTQQGCYLDFLSWVMNETPRRRAIRAMASGRRPSILATSSRDFASFASSITRRSSLNDQALRAISRSKFIAAKGHS